MTRALIAGLTVALLLAASSANAAIQKGDGPTMIRTGYGSVWVGTGGGWVMRINPRTHRIVQRIKVHGFVHGLAAAYGSIWVAIGPGPLKRIDPTSGRVQELWSRDYCASNSLAIAAGRIWIMDGEHDRLCRIDPYRNRIVERVPIEGAWLSVWADGSRLWLAVNMNPKPPMVEDNLEHVRLIALDPKTLAPLGPTIDTAGGVGFAAGFGSLWASDSIADTLARIDPLSGRTIVLRSGIESGVALTAGFGALWVPGGPTLQRVDPRSLATVAEVPIAASAVAVGSGRVWALSVSGGGTRGTVTEVDPRTNRIVGRPISIVAKP